MGDQLGLPGVDTTPRSKRTIYAPCVMRPVADCVDPEHGPDEIPPAPGLDGPGSWYLVGTERERWVVAEDWAVETADGRVLGLRDATAEMKRRGARLMYLARQWGPDMERPGGDESAPLRDRGATDG